MANDEHLKLIREGVTAWNLWRADHPDVTPDLRGAGLRGHDFGGANLDGADLRAPIFAEQS